MDFLNLIAEYEARHTHINHSMKTLESFHSFFSVISRNLEQFTMGTHVALQALFTDLMQYDNHSALSKNFFAFYRIFEKFLAKTKQMSEKVNYELVEPTQLMLRHLEEKNGNALIEMKDLINNTLEQKRLHEVAKHNYFHSCRVAEKQEAKVLKSLDDKEKAKGSDNEVERQHNTLVHLRTLAENNCQKYKTVLKITNDVFEQHDISYLPLVNKLKDNEESRCNFLKYHFEKFNTFIDDIGKAFTSLTVSMKDALVEINVEDDMKAFNGKFAYGSKTNPSQRVVKEDFLQYDIYRRNLEALIRSNSTLFNKSSIKIPIKQYADYSSKQPGVELKQYSFDLKEEVLISSLFNDIAIEAKAIGAFEAKLKANHLFSKDFIDKLLEKFKRNIQIVFVSKEKTALLVQLLWAVELNERINKDMFEVNYAIIYIAEKAYYVNQTGHKVYLCKLLSESHSAFKSKQYWQRLIQFKINTELKTKAPQSDINKKEKAEGKLSYVKNTIGLIFSAQTKEEPEKSIASPAQLKEISGIIKDFLFHFSNFSLELNEANDILIELTSIYQFSSNQLSLFVSVINSNLYSIKSKPLKVRASKSNKKIFYKNFLRKKAFHNDQIHKHGAILNSMKYLTTVDYFKIISLNSSFQKRASKYIYQSLLWDSLALTCDQRASLWKNALNYRSLSPYGSVLAMSKSLNPATIETIQLDTKRTSYQFNQKENREKTESILIALSYLSPDIGYCQGMNYICCFFINIIDDEEKCFEVFNAMVTKSKYSRLIENDFYLLKAYFYVFDRLLAIYLPEVSSLLKKNAIFASFYLAPIFITLFTDSYNYLPNGQKPIVLLRIFDLFMFGGWNAMLNVSLCLLKSYESAILGMKFEDLLHFLINDIIKSDFFHETNFERFVAMYHTLKAPSGLISNLENEFQLEKRIKKEEDMQNTIRREKEVMTHI